MKQIWKRNIVAATVLLFVCGAVYLNWKYASSVADPAADQSGKVLGQSTLVNGDNGGETETEGENINTEGDSASTSGDYFATARLTRQRHRTAPRGGGERECRQGGGQRGRSRHPSAGRLRRGRGPD